jgi:hypothetical protein
VTPTTYLRDVGPFRIQKSRIGKSAHRDGMLREGVGSSISTAPPFRRCRRHADANQSFASATTFRGRSRGFPRCAPPHSPTRVCPSACVDLRRGRAQKQSLPAHSLGQRGTGDVKVGTAHSYLFWLACAAGGPADAVPPCQVLGMTILHTPGLDINQPSTGCSSSSTIRSPRT